MDTKQPTAYLALSGGPDSLTLLGHYVMGIGATCRAAIFNYGQYTYAAESAAARRQCEHYGVMLDEVDVADAGDLVNQGDVEVTREGHDYGIPDYVPNRDLWLMGTMANVASVHGIDAVAMGLSSIDPVPPEKRMLFAALFSYFDVRLELPFQGMDKIQVIQHGERLGVPFEKTVSCYRTTGPGQPPCRDCPSCGQRIDAFARAGVIDPLDAVPA